MLVNIVQLKTLRILLHVYLRVNTVCDDIHTLSLTDINCFTTTTSANNNTLVTELNKHRAALITDARSLIESSNTASHSFSMEAPVNKT